MKMKAAVFIIALACVVAGTGAAESLARISYAEGSGFTLVSGGVRRYLDIGVSDIVGLDLSEGDTVLTEDGAYVEILLTAGDGGIIRIAENTTFTLTSLEEEGGGVFKVIYGRIRVKVASLAGASRLWITGHDTVAGVRGTDFGYDLFYDTTDDNSVRSSSVYVFDGEVDVVKIEKDNITKKELMDTQPLVLKSGKMVRTSSAVVDEKLRAVDIDQDIVDYWAAAPIVTSLGVLPVLEEDSTEVSESLNLNDPGSERQQEMETGGKIVFAAGVGLMTVGGLLRVFAPSAADVSTGLLVVGAGTVVGGTGMLIYSIQLR